MIFHYFLGGRGSSSRGSSFGGSRGKGGFGGSSSGKSKSFSTLKKVAVVGAVAYGGYKLGQLSTRFDGSYNNFNPGYNFNQWKTWRAADGFLCRNDNDCNWLDRNLECERVRDFGWSINVRLS